LVPAGLQIVFKLLAVVLELVAAQAELAAGDDCAAEYGDAGKALQHGGAGVVLELEAVGCQLDPLGRVADPAQVGSWERRV
jgi:hypothetical protein